MKKQMLWQKEETWKTSLEACRLMNNLKGGFRTSFVQAAYSECYVAYKLKEAGFDVKFHECNGCDISISFPEGLQEKILRIEVKHSQNNKDRDKDGHGYSSWVISKVQVEKKKFDYCILVRDSLTTNTPDAVYVFSRSEISEIKPVDVNPPKVDYYLWYSEFFSDICKKYEWMRNASNSLVRELNGTPSKFENRWNLLLKKKLPERDDSIV